LRGGYFEARPTYDSNIDISNLNVHCSNSSCWDKQ
jgi:hypothetical protein